jgi:predicted RecB family nuclease
VYEASFRAGGVFVAVDILKRDGRGFRLIEVKSTTAVKDHHIPEVAIQAHVLTFSDRMGLTS